MCHDKYITVLKLAKLCKGDSIESCTPSSSEKTTSWRQSPCFFRQVLSQLGELAHSARQASYSRRRPKPHPLDACRFLASSSSIVKLCRHKDSTRSLHLARGQVALPNRSASPPATARVMISAVLACEIWRRALCNN